MNRPDNVVVRVFVALLFMAGCESNNIEEMIDCDQSTLAISLTTSTDASSCTASDGSFAVAAQGGSGNYTFTLNATTNSTGLFQGLSAGTYSVSVKDGGSCETTIDVSLGAIGSTLSATASVTPDTGCTTNNGVISLVVTAGIMPYQFKLNNDSFSNDPNFVDLNEGKYSVTVKDAQGCIVTISLEVPKGPSDISFGGVVKPILDSKCNIPSCHNGDLGASRNWTVQSTATAAAQSIKARTQSRNMPPSGSLTQEQIDLLACWADGL